MLPSYLYKRLNSYNLQQREYQQELNMIHNILHNNSFPIKLHKPPTPNLDKQTTTHTTQKWTSFTYISKKTSYITNIFKPTDLRITFHAHDKYSVSGVYKLTCPGCHKTCRTNRKTVLHLLQRTLDSVAQPQHLIEEAHSFGPMNNIMEILQCHKKGAHLNTIEKFHIHTEAAKKQSPQ